CSCWTGAPGPPVQSALRSSAAAVLLVGDVLAPGRLRPVVRGTLGDGQVGHEVVPGGAVPVPLVRRGQDDLARADLGGLAATGLDEPPALEHVEGLPDRVRMPGRAR